MNLTLPLKLAWQSLFADKGRTFLTILGITIGIAAVIMVMSAGESIKRLVLGEIEAFGSNFIQTEIKVPSTSKTSSANAMGIAKGIQITTLKLEDAEAIGKLPNVENYYAGVLGQKIISYLDQNKTTNIFAVSASEIEIDQRSEIELGRFFTDDEDTSLSRVAVLGSKTAFDLFSGQNPVGLSVKIGRQKFKVIGVLKERGGGLGFNFDDMAYVPIRTAQKIILGIDYVSMITTQVKDPDLLDQTADEINALLRERHDITDPKDEDFAVTTVTEAREIINTVFGGITLLLISVAGISLIVGGIGIMNIMYVSVTERTFEIGLRKAVGAKHGQILWQFLYEAIGVTVLGGVIGIVLGVILSLISALAANQLGFDNWQFRLPPQAVIIAFAFCAAVGIVFGYLPAKKAADMDPIKALGFES